MIDAIGELESRIESCKDKAKRCMKAAGNDWDKQTKCIAAALKCLTESLTELEQLVKADGSGGGASQQ